MTHGNQRNPDAVLSHVFEVLDPKVAGDPELVAGKAGTDRIRRSDLNADRGQVPSPGRIDGA
jgi:hypothetical protein